MKPVLQIMFVSMLLLSCHHGTPLAIVDKDTVVIKIIDGAIVYGDTTKINHNNLTETDRKKLILTVNLTGKQKDHCAVPSSVFYTTSTVLKNESNDTLTYVDWTCSHSIWTTDSKFVFADDDENTSCSGCEANYLSPISVIPHGSKEIDLIVRIIENGRPRPKKFRVGMVLERVIKQPDFDFYSDKFEYHHGNLQAQTQNLIWSNEVTIP